MITRLVEQTQGLVHWVAVAQGFVVPGNLAWDKTLRVVSSNYRF